MVTVLKEEEQRWVDTWKCKISIYHAFSEFEFVFVKLKKKEMGMPVSTTRYLPQRLSIFDSNSRRREQCVGLFFVTLFSSQLTNDSTSYKGIASFPPTPTTFESLKYLR